MSLFQHLKLQPIEPSEDGSVSELDQSSYGDEDTIDLSQDENVDVLRAWENISRDMHEE